MSPGGQVDRRKGRSTSRSVSAAANATNYQRHRGTHHFLHLDPCRVKSLIGLLRGLSDPLPEEAASSHGWEVRVLASAPSHSASHSDTRQPGKRGEEGKVRAG